MTQEQILKELEQIFRSILKNKMLGITTESKLSDIKGWDSLSNIYIIEEIETRFNVELYAGEVVVLKTIKDLVQLIQSKL